MLLERNAYVVIINCYSAVFFLLYQSREGNAVSFANTCILTPSSTLSFPFLYISSASRFSLPISVFASFFFTEVDLKEFIKRERKKSATHI